jgi:Ser/Thr protein kinase RdoA (MazF antagonist)
VVVKFPVPPQERRWLEQLQPDRQQIGDVVPRLLDSGKELGGYDLAWVVMERLPHGPLDSHYQGNEVDLLIEALGRFHAAASHCPVDRPPRDEDWPAIMRKARKACQTQQLPHNQRWHKALKAVQKKLKAMLKTWSDRPVDHWCHGDVHFANAMTRSEPPHGPALLFDLAEVHAGHWIEDAVYFEHLFWGHDDRIGHRDVVKELAEQRKQLGLDVDAQWPRWAGVRRMLIAAAAPAYLQHRGNHRHLDHCLNLLEQDLHTVH